MRERQVEFGVTLVNESSQAPTEINISWQVVVTATVRTDSGSRDCPGETLVEDVYIESVRDEMIRYGQSGVHHHAFGRPRGSADNQIHQDRVLHWLQQELASGDRDDTWLDQIRRRAIERAMAEVGDAVEV